MLSAYKKVEGVALLEDTGVDEEDLLQVIPKFTCWMEKHKDANIISFFSKANLQPRIIKALATIGFKTVIDELNKEAEEDKK